MNFGLTALFIENVLMATVLVLLVRSAIRNAASEDVEDDGPDAGGEG